MYESDSCSLDHHDVKLFIGNMEWNYYKIDYEYFHLGRLCIHSVWYSVRIFEEPFLPNLLSSSDYPRQFVIID